MFFIMLELQDENKELIIALGEVTDDKAGVLTVAHGAYVVEHCNCSWGIHFKRSKDLVRSPRGRGIQ